MQTTACMLYFYKHQAGRPHGYLIRMEPENRADFVSVSYIELLCDFQWLIEAKIQLYLKSYSDFL